MPNNENEIWTVEYDIDALHGSANHENYRRNTAFRRAEAEADFATKMGKHNISHRIVHLNYDGEAEVVAYRQYNNHSRKSETCVACKKFPRCKYGTFNWARIKKAAELVAAYRAREKADEQTKKNNEERTASLRQELNTEAVTIRPDGTVSVHVTVKSNLMAEKIIRAIRGLGIVPQ